MLPEAAAATAFFLPATHGPRFCLHHAAAIGSVARGSILYVHPFGEEMNCSRRIVARQCRAFAAQGWQVLQIDLGGCGDSGGDLIDASLTHWLQDLRDALSWLGQQPVATPVALWGVRFGALLALEFARTESQIDQLLFWQPVTDGAKFLAQFLRMAVAADFAESGTRPDVTRLRQQLVQRGSIEIAGYPLSATLAAEIEQLHMRALVAARTVCWLQAGSGPTLAPASTAVVERWRAAGVPVLAECVPAPPFWTAPGYDRADALMAATKGALQ